MGDLHLNGKEFNFDTNKNISKNDLANKNGVDINKLETLFMEFDDIKLGNGLSAKEAQVIVNLFDANKDKKVTDDEVTDAKIKEFIKQNGGNAEDKTLLESMKSVIQAVVNTFADNGGFYNATDANGNVIVYKARLVAKGFRQIQGVDYKETFSPVAKLKSVRIMLAIAAFYDYEIWQMDVKTAFLNGFLKEELYMMQPEGFVDPKGANKVCKLQRSIYGLVQASRSWNKRFDSVIKAYGLYRLLEKPVFTRK